MTEQEAMQRLHHALVTIAMQSARNEIKDGLRRQGKKVSLIPMAEINAMAKARLLQHQARLLADAGRKVMEWVAAGDMGKRMQQALRAKLSSPAQRPGPCSDKTISVLQSCAEWRGNQ